MKFKLEKLDVREFAKRLRAATRDASYGRATGPATP